MARSPARGNRPGLPVVTLMMLACPAAAGAATFFNSSTTALSECTAGCTGVVDDEGTGVAFSSVIDTGRGSAVATANAGVGFIRAFVSVSVTDDPLDRSGRAAGTAEGEFSDSFVIDGGPLNGTRGSMDFVIAIGGGGVSATASNDLSIRPFPAADASHRTRVSLEASCFGCEIFVERFGDATGFGETVGTLGESLEFVFGQPIDLFVEGISAASVQGEGIASADFANTIEWGGIGEVRSEDGSPVTDFEVSSVSGVDWSQPVVAPAPGPLALGLASAATLMLRARLRGRSVHCRP